SFGPVLRLSALCGLTISAASQRWSKRLAMFEHTSGQEGVAAGFLGCVLTSQAIKSSWLTPPGAFHSSCRALSSCTEKGVHIGSRPDLRSSWGRRRRSGCPCAGGGAALVMPSLSPLIFSFAAQGAY